MDQNSFKIAAKSADKSIMLKWSAVEEADGYRVYLKEQGEFKGIRNVTETSVKLTGLENGRLYTFMVKASYGGDYAGQSEEISQVPLGTPTGLKAVPGGNSALLTWDAVENIDSYRVYISDNAENTKFSAYTYAGKETCVVTKLTDGVTYKFKVRGVKYCGGVEYYGGFSEAAECVPVPDAMRITPPYLYLEAGDRSGFVCEAENAVWTVSDKRIAEIDGLGSVLASRNGYARVYVAAKDKNGVKRQNYADVIVGKEKKTAPALPLPRYTGQNGLLFPRDIAAKIAVTGDVVCLAEHQAKIGEKGDYSPGFAGAAAVIGDSDYALGSLIYEHSAKKPYAYRMPKIDGQTNYNAPSAFLEAVRNAGFDCVAAAGPVSPDTVSEFIRCGLNYADINKKSRVIANINGLKIAAATFKFDGASAVLNPTDISNVKNEGADFIIAVCRWGISDSHMVRDNQRALAERLAAFGADLIIGGGPGVVQGTEVFVTEDNREVPVFYSLGNLVSSASELRANRDSVILSLTLRKSLESDYAPAKIHSIKLTPFTFTDNFAAVPASGDAYERIISVIGDKYIVEPTAAPSVPASVDSSKQEPDSGPVQPVLIGSALLTDLFPEREISGNNPIAVTEVPKGDWLIVDFFDAAVKPIGGVQPSIKEAYWKQGLDGFIRAVKNAYSSERVVLIKHRLNRFYAVERQVRLSGESPVGGDACSKFSRLIKKLEDYFAEQTNPVVIDAAKDHFAASQTEPRYDSFFIEQTRRGLDEVFNGEKAETGDIWLKRYIYYYDNLNLRGLTPFVLAKEFAADAIAENSSKEFIRDYAEELIEIKNAALTMEDIKDLIESGGHKWDSEFVSAVTAIKAVLEGKFDKSDVDFSVMFDRDFEILGKLTKFVYKEMRGIFPEFGAIINRQTLPFYFKLMRFARKAEYQSLAGAKEALEEYSASSSPLEIDVWGSDISYIAAGLCEKTAVRNYIDKNPFCWAFDKPIECGEELFEPLTSFAGSEERRDSVRNSFKRLAGDIVAKSGSKWLIVDFFDLAGDMVAYKNGFFETDEFMRRTVFFNNIKKDCKSFKFYKNYNKEATEAALEKMIEIVKARYGGNIILNRVSPAEYYIDLEGEVAELPVDKELVEKTGAIIAECEERFIQKTGCYVIDISGYFMSDERYPRGGANIGNYEDMFYRNTALFLSAIFSGNAENKVYDKINPVYRLMKMIDNGN